MPAGPYLQNLFTAGGILPAASLDQLARGINYWQGSALTGDESRPFTVLNQTVAQSIANNTTTPVLFDDEDIDIGSCHSTSSNTSRWTCPASKQGWFRFTAVGLFVFNATGQRQAFFRANGSVIFAEASVQAASASETAVAISDVFYLSGATGDYAELCIAQTSGGSLNTSLSRIGCRMTVTQERIQ